MLEGGGGISVGPVSRFSSWHGWWSHQDTRLARLQGSMYLRMRVCTRCHLLEGFIGAVGHSGALYYLYESSSV